MTINGYDPSNGDAGFRPFLAAAQGSAAARGSNYKTIIDNVWRDYSTRDAAGREEMRTKLRGTPLPPPSEPMAVARALVPSLPHTGDIAHLTRWRGDWYAWAATRWEQVRDEEIRGWLYERTEHAIYASGNDKWPNWAPGPRKISDVLDALGTGILARPWSAEADRCVALQNGVLDIDTKKLTAHTPERFNLYALPYAYEPWAKCPQWLAFLESVLPGDKQAHQFLAEWFGYIVSGRTDLQKMASLIGPPRSGKGTIARVLEALLGAEGVASPNLDKLATQFGEQALIGKRLAILSDVRWNSRNVADAVPVLLAVSGEDSREIPRKNREDWHGKLDVRFMLMSNDLPTFRDSSTALAKRMIHIEFSESFYGREDIGLTQRLLGELPGILNWAVEGLGSLGARGHFAPPASSADVDAEVHRQSSPVTAYIEDCCTLDRDATISLDALFESYAQWCQREKRDYTGTKASFSRALRSAYGSRIESGRTQLGGQRIQQLTGVRVNPWIASSARTWDAA